MGLILKSHCYLLNILPNSLQACRISLIIWADNVVKAGLGDKLSLAKPTLQARYPSGYTVFSMSASLVHFFS
jgi:hypothetical protein